MGTHHRCGVGILVLAWAGPAATAGPATRPAPPPNFAGPVVPTPPQQHAPWPKPPTTLPAALVDDTALLFDQGVADPRSGEYRAVGVLTGDCWGGTAVTDTHAWVLPAPAATARRFAVCWNGLVYPCVTVGPAADLAADVRRIVAGDGQARGGMATAEAFPVAFDSALPIKVCLLLRSGHTDLAEALWPVVAPDAKSEDGRRPQPDDPYLALSTDWAWYAFDRAVCGHMRGDDVVSRDAAKVLADAVPRIEATAARLKFARPLRTDGPTGKNVADPPYIAFVDQLTDLLVDEQRRTDERPVARVLDNPAAYPDQPKRIVALVRDLEVSAPRQWGQPRRRHAG